MSIATLPNFGHRVTACSLPPADEEISIDGFAGFGGWGLGDEAATGRAIAISFNHDENACAAYEINHPATIVLHSDAFEVHPLDKRCLPHRAVGHAHFSPDCTDFSKAKGGAPVSDRVRGLAWIMLPWAYLRKVRGVSLENVEEFQDWGPTIVRKGRRIPDPARRGETFRAFIAALTTGLPRDTAPDIIAEIKRTIGRMMPMAPLHRGLGYRFKTWELRGCDYGAPTIRKRFFMVAKCDGSRIVKPPPTHGPQDHPDVIAGTLQPHPTAAEWIDFSLPCPSVLMNKREARTYTKATGQRILRPLQRNSCKRIAGGVVRHVLNDANPFIIATNHGDSGGRRDYSINEPLRTICSARRGEALVMPVMIGAGSREAQSGPRRVDRPLRTVTAKNDKAIVTPLVIQYNGEASHQDTRSQRIDRPINTIPTENRFGIVAPVMVGCGGTTGTGRPRRTDRPLKTIKTEDRQSLIAAYMVRHFGGMVSRDLRTPMPTATGRATQNQIAVVHLLKNNAGSHSSSVRDPISTVTTGETHGLVASHIMKMRGTCRTGQSINDPLHTITGGGTHLAMVSALLQAYYSSGSGKSLRRADSPSPTVTTKQRLGLVTCEFTQWVDRLPEGFWRVWDFLRRYLGKDAPAPMKIINDELWLIIDIGMRMLQPRELLGCQFGEFAEGWILRGTKTQQVAGIGNSVCPHVARAIVKANFKPRRIKRGEAAA